MNQPGTKITFVDDMILYLSLIFVNEIANRK